MNSWPIRWASVIEARVVATHGRRRDHGAAAEVGAETTLGDGAAAAVEADGRGAEPAADADGGWRRRVAACRGDEQEHREPGRQRRRGIVTVTSGRIVPRWPWPCEQTRRAAPRVTRRCDLSRSRSRRAIRPLDVVTSGRVAAQAPRRPSDRPSWRIARTSIRESEEARCRWLDCDAWPIPIGIVAAVLLVALFNPWVKIDEGHPPPGADDRASGCRSSLLLVVLFEDRKEPEAADVEIEGPRFARFLFSNTRAGLFWLPIRLFLGFAWLEAGWHKLTGGGWIDGGSRRSPASGRARSTSPSRVARRSATSGIATSSTSCCPATTRRGSRSLITFGEIAVGVGLLLGALTGVAAFFGALMNMSFLLAGSASTNPVLFTMAIGLILAWKVAGYYGLDRYLLPALGAPWRPRPGVQRRDGHRDSPGLSAGLIRVLAQQAGAQAGSRPALSVWSDRRSGMDRARTMLRTMTVHASSVAVPRLQPARPRRRRSRRSASAARPTASASPTRSHGSGPPLVVASCWLSHLQYDWQSPVWRHFLEQLGRARDGRPVRRARLRDVRLDRRRLLARGPPRRPRGGRRRGRARAVRAARDVRRLGRRAGLRDRPPGARHAG